MGVCKYCGQAAMEDITDEQATENCLCFEATRRRKLRGAASEAKEIVSSLFGEGAERRGLKPLSSAVVKGLFSVVDLIGRGDVNAVTLTIPGICTAKIRAVGTSIKVERSEGRRIQDVAGEQ